MRSSRLVLPSLLSTGLLVACGDSDPTTTANTTAGTDPTTTTGSSDPSTTNGPTSSGSDSETAGTESTTTDTGTTTDPGLTTDTDPTTDPTDPNTVTTDPSECMDGAEQCKDGEHEVCMDGEYVPTPCAEGEYCDEQTETCQACACTPGEQGSCADPMNIDTCKDDCSGFEPAECPIGQVCVDDGCVALLCAPGSPTCADADSYQICNDQGTDYGDPVECGPGETCQGGTCLSACAAAEQSLSNVGCEFWAVDMSNLPPRDKYVYAVTVSNPDYDDPVTVEIYDRNNGGNEQMIITDTIAPRQLKVFNLSGAHNGWQGYYAGQDAGILGSGVVLGRAFRIKTDLPVIATQFNPIGGATGYTTDASLLLPTHTLGEDYIHLAWNRGFGNGSALNVVATENNTTITVTPSVNTQAGQNGLPAMSAGVPTDVVINRYDYIQIMVGPNDPDLSGSRIHSTAPVAVFGGHSCANVPTTSVTACDHVEEQIFPLETWGKDYIAARNPIRNQNSPEDMVWRIIAAEDNTTVTFDPPVSIGAQVMLNSGQMVQFADKQDFHVTADDPVLVAGYMIGCTGSGAPGCPGDPYMVQMVSVEQYQKDYVFLIDSSYVNDFAKLVRPTGAAVDLKCLGVIPENRWTTIGNSGYDWAVIDMNPGEAMCKPGTNEATSDQGFGIYASGQSSAASYAYPGGLALQAINPQ
ncbi:MAG: IgGFc-binding protein [Nannocystaceae bacterium]